MIQSPFSTDYFDNLVSSFGSTYTATKGTEASSVKSYSYGGSNAPTWTEPLKTTVENGGGVKSDSSDFRTHAFNWIERYVTPSMFASAHGSIILASKYPVASMLQSPDDYVIVGLSPSVSYATSTGFIAINELRTEGNTIIPTKAQPGSLSIQRFMGNFPNFIGRKMGADRWAYNNQSRDYKNLFSLAIISFNTARTDVAGILIFEKCAIVNHSSAIQREQFQLVESVNIVFDRVVDNKDLAYAGLNYGTSSSTTGTSGVGDTDRKWDIGVFYPGYDDLDEATGLDNRTIASDQREAMSAIVNNYEVTAFRTNVASIMTNKLQANPSYQTTAEYAQYAKVLGMIDNQVTPYYKKLFNQDPTKLSDSEFAALKSTVSELQNVVKTYKSQGTYFPSL